MTTAIALTVGVVAGGSLTLLSGWGLRDLTMRRARRNLASALIGEIVAVLRVVETHDPVGQLARVIERPAEPSDPTAFSLPMFTIYQGNADKLAWFRSPLPRQIAFFYARLAGLALDFPSLAAPATEARAEQARRTLAELQQTLELADDVLRGLRALVSRRRPSSISRA